MEPSQYQSAVYETSILSLKAQDVPINEAIIGDAIFHDQYDNVTIHQIHKTPITNKMLLYEIPSIFSETVQVTMNINKLYATKNCIIMDYHNKKASDISSRVVLVSSGYLYGLVLVRLFEDELVVVDDGYFVNGIKVKADMA